MLCKTIAFCERSKTSKIHIYYFSMASPLGMNPKRVFCCSPWVILYRQLPHEITDTSQYLCLLKLGTLLSLKLLLAHGTKHKMDWVLVIFRSKSVADQLSMVAVSDHCLQRNLESFVRAHNGQIHDFNFLTKTLADTIPTLEHIWRLSFFHKHGESIFDEKNRS